jgi:hypothetical protein
VAGLARRPTLTASARGGETCAQVGAKERLPDRTKERTGSNLHVKVRATLTLHAQQSRRAPSIGMLRVSFFGGLIQAAVGRTGGFGTTPLKRMGWAANAASSVIVRCSVRAAAVPSWTAAGGMKPIPL